MLNPLKVHKMHCLASYWCILNFFIVPTFDDSENYMLWVKMFGDFVYRSGTCTMPNECVYN